MAKFGLLHLNSWRPERRNAEKRMGSGKMTISVDSKGDGLPVSTLTGVLDQAALQGLLRRLYSLGLPLISVHCIEND